jgi:hypothetical protein
MWHVLGSLTGDDLRSSVESLVGDVLAQTLRGQVRTQDARGAAPVLLEFDITLATYVLPVAPEMAPVLAVYAPEAGGRTASGTLAGTPSTTRGREGMLV